VPHRAPCGELGAAMGGQLSSTSWGPVWCQLQLRVLHWQPVLLSTAQSALYGAVASCSMASLSYHAAACQIGFLCSDSTVDALFHLPLSDPLAIHPAFRLCTAHGRTSACQTYLQRRTARC
jgi:hypothetical protein